MSTAHDDNVHPIRPGIYDDFIVDHDEDGDGVSDSTELVAYEPPVPAVQQAPLSIIDVKVLPPKSEIAVWLDECRGGIELRWHIAKVHAVRSWLYFFRASRHSPRGLWVSLTVWWAWVRDWDLLDEIDGILRDGSVDGVKRAASAAAKREERKMRIRKRWAATAVGVVLVPVLALYGWDHYLLITLIVAGAAIITLGLIGAQRHEIVPYEAVETQADLSVDLLVGAFTEAKITKWDNPVTITSVPFNAGRGWVARVKLPGGVTAADVLRNQVELASGLDRPADCLDIDTLPRLSERMIEVFVAHEHPMEMTIPEWPLMAVDRWDIWQPIPVGWDVRGNEVHMSLLWVMTLVGAAMQRGKTTLIRLLAIAALLDPRVDLILVDFKGGVDWVPYQPFCRTFLKGPRQVGAFADLLDTLDAEYERRMAAISDMSLADVPQGRVTPAMAETAGFRPIVVIVDEMQIATESEDGKAITKKWAELQKVCPAAAITFIAATQKPDETSVPTFLRDSFLQRVGLSVATRHASVAILGDEAYKVGLNAAALGGMPGYGISWAQDSEAGPGYRGRLRIPNCTPAMAAVMLQRVARLRGAKAVEAGTDTAQPKPEVPLIVADVLRVWPKGAVVAHLHDLAEALGRSRAEVSGPLRELGLAPHQNLKIRGVNRSGYDLLDVQKLAGSDPL